jgi:anti-sigma B factor antagonist
LGSGAEPGNELSFDVREGEKATVVAVEGEVDMSTAPQFDHYLCALVDRDVVVDLSGVAFLDSSGVSALVHVLHAFEARGRTMRVVGERDNVRTVFEVTGVYDVLHRDT